MKKKVVIFGVLLIVIIAAAYFLFFNDQEKTSQFSFVQVTRGDLNSTITSSGTIEAISTVEVGTQVSGIISKIYVDFNDDVKKGQLLAVLDTTSLAATVRDQTAGLAKAKAQYNEAVAKHERNKKLFDKGYLSELDFIASKTTVESAYATLESAKSSLERAKTNLDYAFIHAPISGKIINRNVEARQTVAASFSTPTLFTIAENLSKMQILADVDESDIGQIKVGQKVIFTVQAYPEKNFKGEVVQIRLSPETISNVVNYTVVVNADNSERLLLPGMTATLDFYVKEKKNVLLIPNMALRFQPTETMMADFRAKMEERIKNTPDSLRRRFGGNRAAGGFNAASMGNRTSGRAGNFGRVWYLDKNGDPTMAMVVTGMTDGKSTEVVRGRNITEGMKLISGVVENGDENNNSNSSNNRGMRRGFGRF